jgi:hypothetical protein
MRFLAPLALIGLAFSCHAPVQPRHDAGLDAGADAGAEDAGSTDGGSIDAGPAPLSLYAMANPNSVLSAYVRLHWTVPLTSVQVQVSNGTTSQITPAQAVSGASGSVVVPLLPLTASTSYSVTATGTDSTGTTFTSNAGSFTTGALPVEVPIFTVADGGSPSPGPTLISVLMSGGFVSEDFLTIVDSTGAPVWYYAAKSRLAGDFQQQPDGTFTLAVLDSSSDLAGLDDSLVIYRQVDVLGATLAEWSAADDPNASPPFTVGGTDGHDLRIQPNGDALLFGFVQQTMDLTSLGGVPNSTVTGNVLQRITKSGAPSFSWNAFDHLDVKNIDPESGAIAGTNVDFTHANSIDVTADGNYLIGLRNLSQVLKIDATSGDILWKLGGADGQFTFQNDPLDGFSCQHGARELPSGDIILFDDGDGHNPQQSRAVEYNLDTTAMTATLVWSAEDNPPLYSYILGYAQRLTNGNTLVSYGTALHVQEVDSAGNVLWDLTDPYADLGIYRSYRLNTISPLALTTP